VTLGVTGSADADVTAGPAGSAGTVEAASPAVGANKAAAAATIIIRIFLSTRIMLVDSAPLPAHRQEQGFARSRDRHHVTVRKFG